MTATRNSEKETGRPARRVFGSAWPLVISAGAREALATGTVNVGLRVLTQGSRLLLVVFLARSFPLTDLGIYGLISVTITFGICLLGLDFNVFNVRELLSRDRSGWAPLLRDQVVFHSMVYCVALPLMAAVFVTGILEWRFAVWVYVLLILEHACQEVYKVIEASGRPTLACVYLFVRSGAWVWVFLLVAWRWPRAGGLPLLLALWAAGCCASLIFAAPWLRGMGWRTVSGRAVDWHRIGRGLQVAGLMSIASLCPRVISLMDRSLLSELWGNGVVGVFSFFYNVAHGVVDFVSAGVIIVLYPRLVAAYRRGDETGYKRILASFRRRVSLAALTTCGAAAVGILIVLPLLKKQEFRQYLSVYWWLLAAAGLEVVGLIPYFELYAKGRDRAIVFCAVGSLLAAAGAYAVLIPRYGAVGAAVGFFLSTGLLAGMRMWASGRKGITERVTP